VPVSGGSTITTAAIAVADGAAGQVVSGQASGINFNVSARYVDPSGNPLSDWNAATEVQTG
jgi:hypothetical protein